MRHAYVQIMLSGMPGRLQQPSWRTTAFVHALSACEMMVGSFQEIALRFF